MAYLRDTLEVDELKNIKLSELKKKYMEISNTYNKLKDGNWLFCHRCGEFQTKDNFYTSNDNKSGYFCYCKKCCLEIAEQRTKKNDHPNLTKDSMIELLRLMNLPYVDNVFEACVKDVENDVNQKSVRSPALQYLTIIKSLPQYNGKTFKNSVFPINYEGSSSTKKPKASTIKRFGEGLNNEDYLYLQNEYEDWITRYECNTKAQEELFEQLSLNKWQQFKCIRENKPTKDLVKAYQELMSTANITPKQNGMDAMSEGQTIGQLIEKWETERPIPEIDPELKDVDNIGLYIDTFFKGHLAKMLNLKNPLQHIYENYIQKYTVKKPEYDEDSDSEELFDKIFGSAKENG